MPINFTPGTAVAGTGLGAAFFNTNVGTAWTNLQATWSTWTPVFTSGVTVGNGTVSGFQTRIGKSITATFQFTMGSTSSIVSTILPQFPVAISTSYVQNWNVGSCTFFDTSAGTRQGGGATVNSTSAGSVGNFLMAGPVNSAAAAVPFTWATGDQFSATITYFAA